MKPIVRFAPSPTGYLHIGGARTALFNYLFARKNNGKFLLRIEDTDEKRNNKVAEDAIYEGLRWLGIDWEGDAFIQSQNKKRHIEVALKLVELGKAYFAYETEDELEQQRQEVESQGKVYTYNRKWRDEKPIKNSNINPVVRIKAPLEGSIIIEDVIKGRVEVDAQSLDDFIILRSNQTPTYLLSAVVDDFDMGITHIIRGDEHFTNAFRQKIIFDAMNWQMPITCHIPLIHGSDGTKLSKRHGATSLVAYKDMGILPSAMFNYLLRLGFGYKDEEIFSKQKAIELFSLDGLGTSPSQFDFKKLLFLNHHYLKEETSSNLKQLIFGQIINVPFSPQNPMLEDAIDAFKPRCYTYLKANSEAGFLEMGLLDYLENFFSQKSITKDLNDAEITLLKKFKTFYESVGNKDIKEAIKAFCAAENIKFPDIAKPLRYFLCGTKEGVDIGQLAKILGSNGLLERLSVKY
jgi:glutamyl-tRNA synthetase